MKKYTALVQYNNNKWGNVTIEALNEMDAHIQIFRTYNVKVVNVK